MGYTVYESNFTLDTAPIGAYVVEAFEGKHYQAYDINNDGKVFTPIAMIIQPEQTIVVYMRVR
jgi:hypothetical protein